MESALRASGGEAIPIKLKSLVTCMGCRWNKRCAEKNATFFFGLGRYQDSNKEVIRLTDDIE